MQISSASLLAAQQARSQTSARPAQAKSADEFEPLLFAAKTDTPKPAAATAQPSASSVTPFTRPGSQIDIKI